MVSENKLLSFTYIDFMHPNLDTTIKTLKLDEVQTRLWYLKGLDFWVSSNSNFIARVWRLSRQGEVNEVYTLPFHSDVVSDLKYASKIDCIISCSMDGSLKMWNTSFREKHSEIVKGKAGQARKKAGGRRENATDGIRGRSVSARVRYFEHQR